MNRSTFLSYERDTTQRRIAQPLELRASEDGNTLIWDGFFTTYDQEYPVYGGEFPGWMETVAGGATRKTIREGADVSFLVNHAGITLARTKSGTMELNDEKRGGRAVARMDRRIGAVNDLFFASERGDIDEMSYAFRVTRDQWFDNDGEPSDEHSGTRRLILEVNMNKGDVSAVNYGANDNTSGGFRALEQAFAEFRDGRAPAEVLDRFQTELRAAPDQWGMLDQHADSIQAALNQLRETIGTMRGSSPQEGIGPDGTFLGPTAGSTDTPKPVLFEGIEVLAAQLAMHDAARRPL